MHQNLPINQCNILSICSSDVVAVEKKKKIFYASIMWFIVEPHPSSLEGFGSRPRPFEGQYLDCLGCTWAQLLCSPWTEQSGPSRKADSRGRECGSNSQCREMCVSDSHSADVQEPRQTVGCFAVGWVSHSLYFLTSHSPLIFINFLLVRSAKYSISYFSPASSRSIALCRDSETPKFRLRSRLHSPPTAAVCIVMHFESCFRAVWFLQSGLLWRRLKGSAALYYTQEQLHTWHLHISWRWSKRDWASFSNGNNSH